LTNVKRYQPSSILAISYLTSLLTDWNFILKETTRKWQDHKLHAPFFDYLNFSLPCVGSCPFKCGSSCPFKYAVAKKYSLFHDKSRLYLDFSIPRIDSVTNSFLYEYNIIYSDIEKRGARDVFRVDTPSSPRISTSLKICTSLLYNPA
jgi:hypothetical protein